MESGIKRIFFRKRSKSRPLFISAPLTDTFRQTAGYDEFAAGPPPTVGTWPIKPSEQKVKRKSFSHIKAKSVGLQDFRQPLHTEPDVRPRTAPGTKPTVPAPLDSLEFKTQDYAFPLTTPVRSKSTRAPPKVPDLPKGLAEMGGSRYFDLLQAAVSTSMVGTPTGSTRTTLDFYNESIASRNSLYGKVPELPELPAYTEVPIASAKPRNNNSPAQAPDAQRASFDAMRASRDLRTSARDAVDASMSQSSTVELKTSRAQPRPGKAARRGVPRYSNSGDFAPSVTPEESRRLKRESGKQTDAQPEPSPAIPSKSSPPRPPAASSSTPNDNKSVPVQSRSRTVSEVPGPGDALDGVQVEIPTVLALKPFEDGLGRRTSADDIPVTSTSHSLSAGHKSTASQGSPLDGQPLSFGSGDVPPAGSTTFSRKRAQHKLHSSDSLLTSGSSALEKMAGVKSASWKKLGPSRTVTDDLKVEDAERNSDDDPDSDCDVGIEEAVAQQADPVQILRASVVSANGYVYKGGDNVIVGKILHHRPSPRLSQIENGGFSSTLRGVASDTQFRAENVTSAVSSAPSPTASTSSDADLHTKAALAEGQATAQRSLQSSPGPGTTSLKVPPGEPPEATTRLPKPDHHKESPTMERNSPSLPIEKEESPGPKSARTEVFAPRKSASICPPSSVLQQAWRISTTNRSSSNIQPPAAVATRDFANPPTPPRADSPKSAGQHQSLFRNGFSNSAGENLGESAIPRDYLHNKARSESPSSELDRSIATKKEAAAKALLKLREVMATPTWEEPSTAIRPRTHTKVPSHWRGLSIEDGSPIAPSAIFQNMKMPVLVPALSRHSTLSRRGRQDPGHNPDSLIEETAEGASAPLPQATLNMAAFSLTREDDALASGASSGSPEPPWFRRRGRSDTTASQARETHSRVGSTVSTNSRTSMYSLPYHMVPARSSSMRDSEGSLDDAGESPRFHVGELGWH